MEPLTFSCTPCTHALISIGQPTLWRFYFFVGRESPQARTRAEPGDLRYITNLSQRCRPNPTQIHCKGRVDFGLILWYTAIMVQTPCNRWIGDTPRPQLLSLGTRVRVPVGVL